MSHIVQRVSHSFDQPFDSRQHAVKQSHQLVQLVLVFALFLDILFLGYQYLFWPCSSCLVVETGPWIFGKKVLLPAGVVNHVDHDDRKVYVDRSKDQIKAAPEYDDGGHADPEYRERLGGYYGGTYGLPGMGVPPGRLM